jgi:hypothetical protein
MEKFQDQGKVFQKVHDLMCYEWDPIGINLRGDLDFETLSSEYINYVPGMVTLLKTHMPLDDILAYLRNLIEHTFCISYDAVETLKVAEKLLQIEKEII